MLVKVSSIANGWVKWGGEVDFKYKIQYSPIVAGHELVMGGFGSLKRHAAKHTNNGTANQLSRRPPAKA